MLFPTFVLNQTAMKYLYILLTTLAFNLNAQIITTVAGNGTAGYSGDGGQATAAELNNSREMAFDLVGNLYFTDSENNRVRKITKGTNIITTIAGTGTAGFSGDGGQATAAELNNPLGIAFDGAGNLYISEVYNSRIRKINSSGIINTFAGTGTVGYSGDGGQASAAEINPLGISFDSFDNLYIADGGNQCVRKINTLGIINTLAGNGTSGFSGDGGQATSANLHNPSSIVIDATGNLYIADYDNMRIRKVNTSGIITTFAGTGTTGYSGDGGEATNANLSYPSVLDLDSMGNLYIADSENERIRKINTSGIITTIVGNGILGFSGDGGQATLAELNFPYGLKLDLEGNMYIADADNNRIRKVTNVVAAGIEQVANINEQVTVYPNPAAKSLHVSLAGNSEDAIIVIRDMLGNVVYHATTNAPHNTIPVAEFASGVYIIEVSNSKGIAFRKFIKE